MGHHTVSSPSTKNHHSKTADLLGIKKNWSNEASSDRISWSCTNCHCNRSSTKRKGPDGTQTLCNACGIYWRRYLKQRPEEFWNPIRTSRSKEITTTDVGSDDSETENQSAWEFLDKFQTLVNIASKKYRKQQTKDKLAKKMEFESLHVTYNMEALPHFAS
eukprot:TRINITY_DN21438_c0_g1_i2.p1 TRINITY_DN21438_c0_g1~~TRINITY_DN21438_c0_g1_i2.p1  ORF type:complete len:161 (-),score=41.51 TRINITY_DN21438_c0_g1_i2:91-573(-)